MKEKAKRGRPRKPLTYVAIILDSSGSMQAMKDQARMHFNENVQAIRNNLGNNRAKVGLVTFNDVVNTHFLNRDLAKLKELRDCDYNPDGMTALWDAMGLTISTLERTCKNLESESAAVLVIIVTDGEENASKEWGGEAGRKRLEEKIKALEATKRWTFSVIGTDSALKSARAVGLSANFLTVKESDAESLAYAASNASMSTANFMAQRAYGVTCSTNFFDNVTAVNLNRVD